MFILIGRFNAPITAIIFILTAWLFRVAGVFGLLSRVTIQTGGRTPTGGQYAGFGTVTSLW
jgi:hypothetical protein